MYKITRKAFLTPSVCLMEVEAPRIAASAKPGQFLIVRSNETAERIPLTICDWDRNAGTVTIVTQIVGASSRIICNKGVGESFSDVAGPLGNPSDFCSLPDEQLKGRKYLMIGGGVGTAPVYPQVKYLQEHGAHCDVIIGARNSSLLIFADEMKSIAGRLFLCTDDGSVGEKGVVTAVAERLIGEGEKYDAAVSIGPMSPEKVSRKEGLMAENSGKTLFLILLRAKATSELVESSRKGTPCSAAYAAISDLGVFKRGLMTRPDTAFIPDAPRNPVPLSRLSIKVSQLSFRLWATAT